MKNSPTLFPAGQNSPPPEPNGGLLSRANSEDLDGAGVLDGISGCIVEGVEIPIIQEEDKKEAELGKMFVVEEDSKTGFEGLEEAYPGKPEVVATETKKDSAENCPEKPFLVTTPMEDPVFSSKMPDYVD